LPGPLDQPLIRRLEVVANRDGGLVALGLLVSDRDGDLVLRADVVGELVDEGVNRLGTGGLGPDDAAFETSDDFVQGATEGDAVDVVGTNEGGGVDASGDVLEQVTGGDGVSTSGVQVGGGADPDVRGANEGFDREGVAVVVSGSVGVVAEASAVIGETSSSGALGRAAAARVVRVRIGRICFIAGSVLDQGRDKIKQLLPKIVTQDPNPLSTPIHNGV